MNTRHIAPSLLMASLISIAAPAAMASDELAGALFGAGAGAVLGHMVGGNDAAVAGGIFGAIIGAAVADNDHRTDVVRPHPHAQYGPAPVRYYAPPPHRNGPRYAHPQWHHDRDGFRDGPRERVWWREGRRGDDRHGWKDRHGRDFDGPRDYRNW